jgi:hypothetical protein
MWKRSRPKLKYCPLKSLLDSRRFNQDSKRELPELNTDVLPFEQPQSENGSRARLLEHGGDPETSFLIKGISFSCTNGLCTTKFDGQLHNVDCTSCPGGVISTHTSNPVVLDSNLDPTASYSDKYLLRCS